MTPREEMHSTQGRAHLLFEMLRGEMLHEGRRAGRRLEIDIARPEFGCEMYEITNAKPETGNRNMLFPNLFGQSGIAIPAP
jgi:hypothetical protein